MMIPKISIIVPIYNAAPYLCRCIDSILSQSFTDYELLLIDDGSTDESGAICDEYATNDARIHVFHKENGGVSSARNMGLDNAQGEWIYFVDADDEVMEDGISTLLRCEKEGAVFAVCGYEKYNTENVLIYSEDDRNENIEDLRDGVARLFSPRPYNNQAYLWNKIFKNELIRRKYIRFDERIKYSEDRLFTIEYICSLEPSLKMYYNWKPIYRYYQCLDSAMARANRTFTPTFSTDLLSYVYILRLLRGTKSYKSVINAASQSMLNSYRWYVETIKTFKVKNPKHRLLAEWYLLSGIGILKYLGFYSKRITRKVKRILKTMIEKGRKMQRYTYPSENNGWEKYYDAPVYGNIETRSMFDPHVYQEDGYFVMLVSERLTYGIDRLKSFDGLTWERSGTVISRIPNTWQHLVNRANMVLKDGVYHLWYTGQSPEVSSIGHSVSDDGRCFVNAKLPCLKAELAFEGVSVMNPCVLWNERKQVFQMWYAAGENYEPDVVCYAESKDGNHWEKWKEPVLTKSAKHRWEKAKVGGCNVVLEDDGTYTMYYIGYQNIDLARICFATSIDGIHWIRPQNNLILSPSKGSWDSDACYKPTVVRQNNKLYLWYNGRKGIEEYIGLATKEIAL